VVSFYLVILKHNFHLKNVNNYTQMTHALILASNSTTFSCLKTFLSGQQSKLECLSLSGLSSGNGKSLPLQCGRARCSSQLGYCCIHTRFKTLGRDKRYSLFLNSVKVDARCSFHKNSVILN